MAALSKKVTLSDLRLARETGAKVPMLTCYDFTTARLMQQAGVPSLLAGDTAASVILGHETTLPVSLDFMIEITAAVRRGAPLAFLVADMPFGSFGAEGTHGFDSVVRMVKLSGCDCVKMEVQREHLPLVKELSASGVAVMAHLGLRPQSVGVLGGYRWQGRTADEASAIVKLACEMEAAGASALLLETVAPPVSQRVVEQTRIPVIGCGAGPACHGHVVVTQDLFGMTSKPPRFVPVNERVAATVADAISRYVEDVAGRKYPAPQHHYEMAGDEQNRFEKEIRRVTERET